MGQFTRFLDARQALEALGSGSKFAIVLPARPC